MKTDYTIHMRCDGGADDSISVTAETLSDAHKLAREEVRKWVREGDWGDDGAIVDAWYDIIDDDGEVIDSGKLTVEIEPDHATLIRRAARGAEICGDDPDDHDWSSEGEGGCDENPGVWSVGGTAMVFASHCTKCGLRRVERVTGSQRNPGEHDTVEYSLSDK